MLKVYLIVAAIGFGNVADVESIEMSTIKQCSEVRETLYVAGRMLMCVKIAVPLPEQRPPPTG